MDNKRRNAKAQLESPKLKAYIDSQVNEAVHERNTIGNEIIRAMEGLAEAQVKAERERIYKILKEDFGVEVNLEGYPVEGGYVAIDKEWEYIRYEL